LLKFDVLGLLRLGLRGQDLFVLIIDLQSFFDLAFDLANLLLQKVLQLKAELFTAEEDIEE